MTAAQDYVCWGMGEKKKNKKEEKEKRKKVSNSKEDI